MSKSEEESRGILSQIRESYNRLSKSHRKIADYIFKHYDQVPNMSATQIAKTVDVSEATVVRFANRFGFDGYPEFRKSLKEEVASRLTMVERIDMLVETGNEGNVSDELVKTILKNDVRSMKETLAAFDDETFKKAVDAICSAKKVIILGFRTAGLLTEHLGYYLDLILDNVRVVNNKMTDFYEHLVRVGEGDVVIAISFPRYSQTTYDVLTFLQKRGPEIISITDTKKAPINRFADYELIAKSNVYSFVDSMAAPLSLIDALIVAIGNRNIETTKKTFNELEKIWKKNDVYANEVFTHVEK